MSTEGHIYGLYLSGEKCIILICNHIQLTSICLISILKKLTNFTHFIPTR